jgi:PHD/YefM family antitoxin component YafN of YafNO toxin-antitoxin module
MQNMTKGFRGEYKFILNERVKVHILTNNKEVLITLYKDNYIESILLTIYAASKEDVEVRSKTISFIH